MRRLRCSSSCKSGRPQLRHTVCNAVSRMAGAFVKPQECGAVLTIPSICGIHLRIGLLIERTGGGPVALSHLRSRIRYEPVMQSILIPVPPGPVPVAPRERVPRSIGITIDRHVASVPKRTMILEACRICAVEPDR